MIDLNLDVLEKLAISRAKLVQNQKEPPFVAYLSPERADMLRDELKSLGVMFGIAIGSDIPDPLEDAECVYLGIVLSDVHVFARMR